jgi:hypothetical protein
MQRPLFGGGVVRQESVAVDLIAPPALEAVMITSPAARQTAAPVVSIVAIAVSELDHCAAKLFWVVGLRSKVAVAEKNCVATWGVSRSGRRLYREAHQLSGRSSSTTCG